VEAAAATHSACRESGARSLDEIAEYSSSSRRDVARRYGEIVRQLGLKVPLPSPADFVPRICERLGLGQRVLRRTVEIAERAGLARKPEAVAAAVYIAAKECGEWRSQKEIAGAVGVTEVTVRNTCRELVGKLRLPVAIGRR